MSFLHKKESFLLQKDSFLEELCWPEKQTGSQVYFHVNCDEKMTLK